MELSRQRLRPSIESKSYQTCQNCHGRGIVMSVESYAVSIMRQISMGLAKGDVSEVKASLPQGVAAYLLNRKRKELAALEQRYKITITLDSDPTLPPGDGKLDFVKEETKPVPESVH
jgi:ribonuclease E